MFILSVMLYYYTNFLCFQIISFFYKHQFGDTCIYMCIEYSYLQVQRAQELVAQESDLTRLCNNNPKLKKRYSINVTRERLQSLVAEQTGEGAINPPLQDIPKYYLPSEFP